MKGLGLLGRFAEAGPYSYGSLMRDELRAEATSNRHAFVTYITHKTNHKKKKR